MEKQSYAKISRWISWALMLISIAVLVWGTVVGYPKTVAADNGTVDPLLYWTYAMIGIALCAVILVGLIVTVKTDPKSLVKMGFILVGVVVVCFIAYLLASGAPAVGIFTLPRIVIAPPRSSPSVTAHFVPPMS